MTHMAEGGAECRLKATTQPWDLGPPPPQHDRAVRVPGRCTWRRFAWATASRLPCEPAAMRSEPVGGQRWWRPLLEQPWARGIVLAAGSSGIFPLAAYARFVGGKLKDWPPGIGTRQDVLAQ
jgi:hypothetical protein